ncbi:hypothetical protein B0H16DRAFT_1474078 [Mycena metata]|uniref:Uncharacterized protein n=1 Tax=Mycena metata TaxID=1033252 RepID=A0AAD7MK38_9AGAR|nr:hypothetical protein B0H16DRAFT_1474078 [Mycena metata]
MEDMCNTKLVLFTVFLLLDVILGNHWPVLLSGSKKIFPVCTSGTCRVIPGCYTHFFYPKELKMLNQLEIDGRECRDQSSVMLKMVVASVSGNYFWFLVTGSAAHTSEKEVNSRAEDAEHVTNCLMGTGC